MSKTLTREQFEQAIAVGMLEMGIPIAVVPNLLNARWPMTANAVLAECSGRGLNLSITDLEEFLWDLKGKQLPDGLPVDPHRIMFDPIPVDRLLDWAVQHDRGTPSMFFETENEPSYESELN